MNIYKKKKKKTSVVSHPPFLPIESPEVVFGVKVEELRE
jgi:hypothetical protein